MCENRIASPGAWTVVIVMLTILVAYSCSVREDRQIAKDEVDMAVLSLEHRQEIINRLGGYK